MDPNLPPPQPSPTPPVSPQNVQGKKVILIGVGILIILIGLVKLVQITLPHKNSSVPESSSPAVKVTAIPTGNAPSGKNGALQSFTQDNITISYPAGWLVQKTAGQGSTSVTFVEKNHPESSIAAQMTIETIPFSTQFDAGFPYLFKARGIIGTPATIDGQPADKYVGLFKTITVNKQSLLFTHWVVTYYQKSGDYSYIITYEYPKTADDPKEDSMFESLLKTLVITR